MAMRSRCWALTGPVAPESWRGTLPITYHVGPGAAKVHLASASIGSCALSHDVVSRMAGSTEGEEWVVRGNHHDAWVNGAEDPISGQVALLEEARALGEIHKQGWQPKRTIIYCSWDGEEPMLLGSTEWAETMPPSCSNTRWPTSTRTATAAASWKPRIAFPGVAGQWRELATSIPRQTSRCGSARRLSVSTTPRTPKRGRRFVIAATGIVPAGIGY